MNHPQEIPPEVARYVSDHSHSALAKQCCGHGWLRLQSEPLGLLQQCPVLFRFGTTSRTGLFDDLYPVGSIAEPERERQRAGLATKALELAERYEATFGRTQLDNVLLEIIPDGEYQPGELHQLLLRLPWADVLTTNYDTLLERTRSLSQTEIMVSNSPSRTSPTRAALESSSFMVVFPSSRPFIFTEEDFRTYPRRFAGFVNLAQQTAMENVLCLIGFSGDDPNFLTWTGWVRDHLGEHSPRIYLCGLFDHDGDHPLITQPAKCYSVESFNLFSEDTLPRSDIATPVRNGMAIAVSRSGLAFGYLEVAQSHPTYGTAAAFAAPHLVTTTEHL